MIYLFPAYPRPSRRLLHSAVHVYHVHAVINQTTVVHVPLPATGVAAQNGRTIKRFCIYFELYDNGILEQ